MLDICIAFNMPEPPTNSQISPGSFASHMVSASHMASFGHVIDDFLDDNEHYDNSDDSDYSDDSNDDSYDSDEFDEGVCPDMPPLMCLKCNKIYSLGGSHWEHDNPSSNIGFCSEGECGDGAHCIVDVS